MKRNTRGWSIVGGGTIRTLAKAISLAAITLAVGGTGGCEDKKPPAGGGGVGAGGQSTPSNPSSVLGKSAKMGKDVKSAIEQTSEQANQAAGAMSGEARKEIGGLRWAIPTGWEVVPASGMRIAEYKAGEGGSVSIRFFATQGTAEMNIARWKGQVKDPTDGPSTKTIPAAGGTVKAQVVAVTGTYSGMGPSGAATAPAANTRFLGAFLDWSGNPVQVVVTGPDEQVRSIEKAWETMLAGVQTK